VVAGYLALPNAGVIEFLFITDSHRGQGLGRRLREEVERLLQPDAWRTGRALD
jgi:GNAT superfamily N-acetyltransferase